MSGCATKHGGWRSPSEIWRGTAETVPPASGSAGAAEMLEWLKLVGQDAKGYTESDAIQVASQIVQRLPGEQNPVVRSEALKVLAALPTAAAGSLTPLVAALHDTDEAVRITAVQLLGASDDPTAVNPLAHALAEDASIDVRLAAARALGEFPNSSAAVGALTAAVFDPNPALQRRGFASLRAISPQDFGNDLHAWREFAAASRPHDSQATEAIASFPGKWQQSPRR
jgi:HEAT repeat protein